MNREEIRSLVIEAISDTNKLSEVIDKLDNAINGTEEEVDEEGYSLDEDGNRLSCCGAVLDEDIMMCTICKEHC